MFSYSNADLTTSLNQVRRLIGDTDSESPEFQDEEVNFFIDQNANIYGAAALICDSLSAKYSQQVDKSVGDLKLSAGQKFSHYSELADKFEQLSKTKGSPQVHCGGISISDKLEQEQDSDRVKSDFYKEQFDYQGVGSNTT